VTPKAGALIRLLRSHRAAAARAEALRAAHEALAPSGGADGPDGEARLAEAVAAAEARPLPLRRAAGGGEGWSCVVFVSRRATAIVLHDLLTRLEGKRGALRSGPFIGGGDAGGGGGGGATRMTHAQQTDQLMRFRDGLYNVMLATGARVRARAGCRGGGRGRGWCVWEGRRQKPSGLTHGASRPPAARPMIAPQTSPPRAWTSAPASWWPASTRRTRRGGGAARLGVGAAARLGGAPAAALRR